jgi:hypothetical protein
MHARLSVSFMLVVSVLAVATACERGSSSSRASSPIAPSLAGNATAPAAVAKAGHEDVLVTMQDACDPTTFNAALGDGTCIRSGGIQFDKFLELLGSHGSVGAWHFSPPHLNAVEGQSFLAVNRGGETHTFTEVEEFAGGIVPALNELMHLTTVAPECTALEPDDVVAPGGTYREEIEEVGVVRVQCCIHPWMRLEAQVRAK